MYNELKSQVLYLKFNYYNLHPSYQNPTKEMYIIQKRILLKMFYKMINIYLICLVTTRLEDGKSLVGAKIGSYTYSGRGDIVFLICYITSRDHAIRESCGFMGDFPLP